MRLFLLLPLLATCYGSSHTLVRYGDRTTPYPCRFRYGTWGPCTATCGSATQTRHNTVYTPDQPGCPALSETRPCANLPPCPTGLFPPGPPAPNAYRRPKVTFSHPPQLVPENQPRPPVPQVRPPTPVVQPRPAPIERPLPPQVHRPAPYGQRHVQPLPQALPVPKPAPIQRPLPPTVHKPVTYGQRPHPQPQPLPPAPYGRPKPKPQQRVPPEPIDNSKYPVDCKTLDDGLVPHPTEKCSHKFYSCANGITFERVCYGKLYYDTETEACDQYQYVPACSGNRRPPATPAPYETPMPYTSAPELDCTKLEDGLYPDPLEKCSVRYFVCDHGSTNEMFCAAGLYFDEQSEQCDRYVKVYACTGRQYVEPEHISKNDHKEPEPVDFDCSVVEDGHYADPLNKCSERFFHCTNKIGYEKRCPGHTYFDEEFGVCDSYSNIPVCSGKPRPTNPPALIEPTGAIITVTLAKDLDYSASPADLKLALAQMLNVPATLIYDVSHPSPKVVRCSGQGLAVAAARTLAANTQTVIFMYNGGYFPVISITITPTAPAEVPPKPHYPFNCDGKYDGNYAAGSCEHYYWVCIGGTTDRMECPGTTKYDDTLDQCENDDYVPGCGGVPRTPPPPTPAQLPRKEPAFDCERKTDGHYLPTPCSGLYYTCSNGETYEQECPGETKFLLEEGRCEVSAKVPACGSGGSYGTPRPYGRPLPVPRPAPKPVRPVNPVPRQLIPRPAPARYGQFQSVQRIPVRPQFTYGRQ